MSCQLHSHLPPEAISETEPTQGHREEEFGTGKQQNRIISPDKHQSIHMYCSIDTIKKFSVQPRDGGLRPRSCRVQSCDYDEVESRTPSPEPHLTDYLSKRKSSRKSAAEMSLAASDYETPFSLPNSSAHTSDSETIDVSEHSSLCSESLSNRRFIVSNLESTYVEMGSDLDLWKNHNQTVKSSKNEKGSISNLAESKNMITEVCTTANT